MSNQASLISEARKIKDLEESGSVQDSIRNKPPQKLATKKQNFFTTGQEAKVAQNEYGGHSTAELRQVSGGSELNQ